MPVASTTSVEVAAVVPAARICVWATAQSSVVALFVGRPAVTHLRVTDRLRFRLAGEVARRLTAGGAGRDALGAGALAAHGVGDLAALGAVGCHGLASRLSIDRLFSGVPRILPPFHVG